MTSTVSSSWAVAEEFDPDQSASTVLPLSADWHAQIMAAVDARVAADGEAEGASLDVRQRIALKRELNARRSDRTIAHAATAGAPVDLITEAERLAAFVGRPDSPGFQLRAIRLAHRISAVNRRLHRYNGLRRSLAAVIVSGWLPSGLGRGLAAAVLVPLGAAVSAAVAALLRALPMGADGPPGTRAHSSPFDAAVLAPILRHGPPAPAGRALAPRTRTGRPLLAA